MCMYIHMQTSIYTYRCIHMYECVIALSLELSGYNGFHALVSTDSIANG